MSHQPQIARRSGRRPAPLNPAELGPGYGEAPRFRAVTDSHIGVTRQPESWSSPATAVSRQEVCHG